MRLEIGINESGGAFGSFTLLANEVSPMGRGLLSAEAVGGKVIPEREDEGASKDAVEQKAKVINAVTTTLSTDRTLIGKKVEVSLRLFDISERNGVFIFLLGS